jgi:ribosomal protein S12 methylthiotransferase accessory factor
MIAEGASAARYRLAAGTEWVQTDATSAIFRSATSKATLIGPNVSAFLADVVPTIDGTHDLIGIAKASASVPFDELQSYFSELIKAGLIVPAAFDGPRSRSTPFIEALASAGRSQAAVTERLKTARFAIFGLESAGAAIARELASWRVRGLVLADPTAQRPDDPATFELRHSDLDRQTALAAELSARYPEVEVTSPLGGWGAKDVRDVADMADVLIVAVDRDFAAVAQWVNKAAIETGKIAAFVTLDGTRATIGPIVYPGETACYMCYRMRAIACHDDYFASMAFEELRDRSRIGSATREPTFLPLSMVAAGILSGEIAKTLTAVGRHVLAGRIIEWDGLTAAFEEHEVLRQPCCPICGKKKLLNPEFPVIGDLSVERQGPGLAALRSRLVGARTGVVRSLKAIRKAPREPEFPMIVRAELSNFRYHREKAEAFQIASGKGADEDSAYVSALGEAVERYSGGIWPDDEVPRLRRDEIDGPSLDPRALVPCSMTAHHSPPYTPWTDDLRAGWVWGRDLGSGERIAVPAQPTLMSYSLMPGEANLFQVTSNGLAAGPTLADAALRAAYEVIERDAFISTWLLRLPADAVRIASLDLPAARNLEAAYARRGVKLELYRLTTTTSVHAFVALGIAEAGDALPAVVVGLGADHDAKSAARSALSEVAQVRPGLKYRLNDHDILKRRDAMHQDTMRVEDLEDHDLYYSSFDQLPAFDFLRRGDPAALDEVIGAAAESVGISPRDRLARLAEEAAEDGARLISVNLSPPDMAELGLYTARAYLTGYQPIYFGQKEMRIAEARLDRLSRRVLGRPFDPAHINPKPHPVA